MNAPSKASSVSFSDFAINQREPMPDFEKLTLETKLVAENEQIRIQIELLEMEKVAQDDEISRLKEEMSTLAAGSDEGGTEESGVFVSKFFEDFTVHDILGQGGFGCVFRAENRYDEWQYAVKRVAVDASKTTIAKALGEVRAMAQLDHPNIVRYNSTWIEEPPEGWQFDADVEMFKKMGSGKKRLNMNYQENCVYIYIQMQMCKYSLTKWLADNAETSSRPVPRMKSWFKQIVSAVAYIHDRNLIHRDLKPSNILFVEEDRLKLCDLGIVTERRLDDGVETFVTRTNIGTQLYMSPELRSYGPKYSSKADVFALGLILTELCVVMTALDRSKHFDNYRRGVQNNLITDRKTAEFVEKLTQVDPKYRPSCGEMLDSLYLA